jgi:hypothetical protein
MAVRLLAFLGLCRRGLFQNSNYYHYTFTIITNRRATNEVNLSTET